MLDKPQLLIIGNDDEVMDLIFEQLVKAFGECILQFTSALSIACNSLADTSFDAILLDPLVANHGKEMAIAAIRCVAPETPVFLLLDRRRASLETEAHGLGPGGCLFKDELKQGIWVEREIERWIYSKTLERNN